MGTLFMAGAAFLLLSAAALSFFSAVRHIARVLFAAGAACQFLSLAVLFSAFIRNDFSIRYVAENSSLATPLLYKISAVWAGQQGSFLLWAFFASAVCLQLLFSKEKWTFSIAAAAAALFAAVSLTSANPFIHGSAAADGQGLKTILQNPWMSVHPPILFLGYALTIIPFARAVDAVLRRDLSSLVLSRASVLLIAAVTGAGIALGGIWAYETLGWGGFWGWDPVENSSLVPWLVSVALIHVLLLQERKGRWEKAAFFLSISLFILTLLSSFLTRSGVLASVSVHSFGSSALALPLGFMTTLAILVPAAAVVFRGRALFPPSRKQEGFKEIVFGTGVVTFIFYAFMILGATLAPLAFIVLGREPMSVKTSFFNNISVVFTFLFLCSILIATPFGIRRPSKKITAGLVIASAALFVAIFLRLTPFSTFVHGSAAAAGALTALCVLRLFQKNVTHSIPFILAHIGFSLFVAGCISTAFLSSGERKEIPAGDTAVISGTEVTFRGAEDNGKKGLFRIDTSHHGEKIESSIPYEKLADGSLMSVSPSIAHGIMEDRYLFVEGFLSKAEIEKIVKSEKLEAKPADTILVNLSLKKMIMPVLAGSILMTLGFFAGFILVRRKK
jgi:cytochrome c-type biogenesis protein CcmF